MWGASREGIVTCFTERINWTSSFLNRESALKHWEGFTTGMNTFQHLDLEHFFQLVDWNSDTHHISILHQSCQIQCFCDLLVTNGMASIRSHPFLDQRQNVLWGRNCWRRWEFFFFCIPIPNLVISSLVRYLPFGKSEPWSRKQYFYRIASNQDQRLARISPDTVVSSNNTCSNLQQLQIVLLECNQKGMVCCRFQDFQLFTLPVRIYRVSDTLLLCRYSHKKAQQ